VLLLNDIPYRIGDYLKAEYQNKYVILRVTDIEFLKYSIHTIRLFIHGEILSSNVPDLERKIILIYDDESKDYITKINEKDLRVYLL